MNVKAVMIYLNDQEIVLPTVLQLIIINLPIAITL